MTTNRDKSFRVRMTDLDMKMVQALAEYEQLPASDVARRLIRGSYEGYWAETIPVEIDDEMYIVRRDPSRKPLDWIVKSAAGDLVIAKYQRDGKKVDEEHLRIPMAKFRRIIELADVLV